MLFFTHQVSMKLLVLHAATLHVQHLNITHSVQHKRPQNDRKSRVAVITSINGHSSLRNELVGLSGSVQRLFRLTALHPPHHQPQQQHR